MKKLPTIFIAIILVSTMLLGTGSAANKEEFDIGEDEYIYAELEDTDEVKIEVEVEEGPSVDVFVMENIEFRKYKNGEEFEYITTLSDQATKYCKLEGEVPGGNYVVVVDNTDVGAAQPPSNMENDVVYGYYTIECSKDTSGTDGFCGMITFGALLGTVGIVYYGKKKE